MELRNKLTPAEYWEWRTTIADLEIAKEKMSKLVLELKLLQKEAEILNARQQLFQLTKLAAARENVKYAQHEYDRFKGELEKVVGSLNDKMIDEFTFEIKDLPEQTNTQKE